MILILGRPSLVSTVTKAVVEATGHRAQPVHSVRSAIEQLKKHLFVLVIIDDGLPELDDNNAKLLLTQAGSAIPVFVNFALSRPERVSSQAQLAIRQVQFEEEAVQRIARRQVEAPIRSALTTVILASERMSGLQTGPIPEGQLKKVIDAAMRIRTKLRGD